MACAIASLEPARAAAAAVEEGAALHAPEQKLHEVIVLCSPANAAKFVEQIDF